MVAVTKKPIFRRSDRPTKPNGLTKQTYSTLIRRENGRGYRKWHIVAYFSTSYHKFPVIEDLDKLRNIIIPANTYMPSRGPTNKSDEHSTAGTTSDDDTQPPTPTSLRHSPNNMSIALFNSPSPITLHHPSTFQISAPKLLSKNASLDVEIPSRPSSTAFPFNFDSRTAPILPSYNAYHPLTPEDARALRSFELKL